MMSRVLVAGGRGLLGSTLVPTLRARGHEVRVLGRDVSSDVRADLGDFAATRLALQAAAPEVIVNLAAATNVDACERDPAAAFDANARAVQSLADWVRQAPGGAHSASYGSPGAPHYDKTGTARFLGRNAPSAVRFATSWGEVCACISRQRCR